jgi:lipopolysaccharide/colanic/teichoic acid biosynthesis glycosyltransferase
LTVEFVAEGAPTWSLPQGGTVGGDGAGISNGVGITPFSSTSVDFRYPPVRLPQQPQRQAGQSQAGWGTGSVTRHGRRGLLGRLPRRSVRQLVESVAALGLIVLFSPLLLATAIAIKLTSRGPMLFRQDRTGLHREIFTMYKFRTMYTNNDDAEHRRLMREMLTADEAPTGGEPGIYKIARDPRVTPVGKILRQFSIDELPQLWNVVRGEMSLVGPRPYVPWEAEFFPRSAEKRFSVRPGMTGLWQVSGRSTVDYRTALQIDVHYAEHKSLWLDLRILARTAVVVFDRSGTR